MLEKGALTYWEIVDYNNDTVVKSGTKWETVEYCLETLRNKITDVYRRILTNN